MLLSFFDVCISMRKEAHIVNEIWRNILHYGEKNDIFLTSL